MQGYAPSNCAHLGPNLLRDQLHMAPVPTFTGERPVGHFKPPRPEDRVALLHRLVRLGHEVSFQNLMPVTL